ncbi:hypothetical protein KI387_032022, partial [Taxus chinensis]
DVGSLWVPSNCISVGRERIELSTSGLLNCTMRPTPDLQLTEDSIRTLGLQLAQLVQANILIHHSLSNEKQKGEYKTVTQYQSEVSILGPVGYGPTTLPLRHSDSVSVGTLKSKIYGAERRLKNRKKEHVSEPRFELGTFSV